MIDALHYFHAVWLCDFEFQSIAGERPVPRCMIAREFRTGRTIRRWADDLATEFLPPFSIGTESLFVAFYASAELGCFRALGWPTPARILDLFTEFRCLTNGLPTTCGNSLLGAMAHFGIDGIDAADKETMRELAMRDGEYSDAEKLALLEYCESDVDALAKLLPAMLPLIDLPRALLRGRYMAAAAAIEWTGVPIDVELLDAIKENWLEIKQQLIQEVDCDYGVYFHSDIGYSFSAAKFAEFLFRENIPWRRLESGKLALDDDSFRQMAKAYPMVSALRELRHTLGGLRLFDLAVGSDRRNRCLLSAFRSITGRNQPGTAEFIFGPSCWLRSLIRPEPGRAVAYVDWSQQEFGIAAALSGDVAMQAAYSSGDPYLEFAKQAGAVPPDATKQSHSAVREQFKRCALAVQYGMGSASLAQALGQPEAYARELLRLHRSTYPRFWKWSEAAVDYAMLHGRLWTVFGWQVQVGHQANPRSLANFPMQANGAEMLRLACCLATERGIAVCAPVHDALLVEVPAESIEAVVSETQRAMVEASRVVLGGFQLRSDTKIICHPDRYNDPRGERMWEIVIAIVAVAAENGRAI